MPETRSEVAWCKRRALEYLDSGDIANAVASMGSDMGKHPETGVNGHLMQLGMLYILNLDAAGARRWIEGFN
jgi:hypothetical protein